jgi:hypothetical protein
MAPGALLATAFSDLTKKFPDVCGGADTRFGNVEIRNVQARTVRVGPNHRIAFRLAVSRKPAARPSATIPGQDEECQIDAECRVATLATFKVGRMPTQYKFLFFINNAISPSQGRALKDANIANFPLAPGGILRLVVNRHRVRGRQHPFPAFVALLIAINP